LWGSRDEISREGGDFSRHTRDEWNLVDTKVRAKKFKQRYDRIPHAELLPEMQRYRRSKKKSDYFFYLWEQKLSVLTQSYTHKKMQSEVLHAFSI
jgi:hypothetical protein